ncbi:MAG TPA: MCE family protein [Trebonia sp.]|nr:MCE family protein [Trebonia sp.]
MLTVLTRAKVALFVVLAVVALAYAGIRYAGVGRFFGVPGYYVVKVNLAQAGGLYTDADVTYRGVTVGRVGSLSLAGSGVQADLDIDNSAPRIPAGSQAVVADLSAVGEQYVDLRPTSSAGPYLTAGDVIPQADTAIPAPVTGLLTNVDALARSLPTSSLQTVVNELYLGFNGQGQDLQKLLDDFSDYTRAANASITPTSELIGDSQGVLATQEQDSGYIESFATSIEELAQQLESSDPDLRALITAAPKAAEQVSGLLNDNDPDLGLTIANLLTTSELADSRQPALQELLSALPALAAIGDTVVTKDGANFGLTLTFFDPLPCTDGYQGTTYENGTDTRPGTLNTNAACDSPSSTGIDVRGSAHAPSGGPVPKAARP